MNVVAINGSPRGDGNTMQALELMARVLGEEGIETRIIQVGGVPLRGCAACGCCAQQGRCAFEDDLVNDVLCDMRQADGLILGTPTYFGGIAGSMKCFLDRAFFAGRRYFCNKVATAVTAVRRSGGVNAVDQLFHYLRLGGTITPPAPSWPVAYGRAKGEIERDGEGVWILRQQARSMAWLMKSLAHTRDILPAPEPDPPVTMNFIR